MPSSVIRRHQYAKEARTLRVVFTSGAVYDYFDVPPEVADAFAAARSKGEFFGKVVRPFFEFEKVRDPDEAGGWRPAASR
jgi:hypothetical protein